MNRAAVEVLRAAITAAHEEQRQGVAQGRDQETLTLFQHWSATAGWLASRIRAIERGDEPDWPDAMNTTPPLAAQEGDQGDAVREALDEDVWPSGCTCGHDAHLHDAEADPALCMVCGDNTRCNYASREEIAADRWEEGHAAGVSDYMQRYDNGLAHKERLLRSVQMVGAWDDNPYRRAPQPQPGQATP